MSQRGIETKGIDLKDPMVYILCGLLLFITFGNIFFGSAKETSESFTSSKTTEKKQFSLFEKKTIYTIELDASFGGDQEGSEGIIVERDVNEAIVTQLESLLKNDENFKVVRTHEAGTAASVNQKAEKINKDKPAMTLSIRCAFSNDASLSGMNIYPDVPSHANNEESLKMARFIASNFASDSWNVSTLYQYYEPFEDGVFRLKKVNVDDEQEETNLETWDILQKTNVPVVVIEQFYITCQNDIDKWANNDGYRLIAEKYYSAIKSYFELDDKHAS